MKQRAFTLVELLVVIAVLALLASTLLPAVAKTKPNSQAWQCLNNHRQMCAAWRMYADDSRDRIVYASDDGTTTGLSQYAWTWAHMDFNPNNTANWDTNKDIVLRPLWPYTGRTAAIYRCPADRSYVTVSGVARPRVRSTAMNIYLGGFDGTDGGWGFGSTYRIFLKTTDLSAPSPANTFVFLDQSPDTINWGGFQTSMRGYPGNPAQYQFEEDFPGMNHNLGCTFSFGDGRAEIKRWVDPRTTPPPSGISSSVPSPGNVDIAWLQDHATRPK
jgi:prepilin-type N-terminal cleavage/methylation domain-containing protein